MNKNNSWAFKLGISLLFLNLIDGINTYYVVTHGLGFELNPIMRFLIGISPIAFLIFKFACTPIYYFLARRAHRFLLLGAFIFYFINVLSQFIQLFLIFFLHS